MSAHSNWEGILDEGEEILWQGRPDGALVLRPQNIPLAVFGLIFAGFALFWMMMAASAGGLFWSFGLIHFSIGIGLIIGPSLWSAYRRRHSWYTLTNARAFIATDIPVLGRRLKSYPILPGARLELIDGSPPSIIFATENRRGKNGTYQVPIGYDRISDARDVYKMMREIQTGDAGAKEASLS
jgi:hypothetical protein